MSPLAAFVHMMPLEQLDLVLELTNESLAAKGKKELTRQQLLRWIGVCMLIASINFRGNRRKLWEGGGAASKYLPSYDLRATGMSRNCFDDIWYAVRWSCQPPEQPDSMSSERYRWMLINNFVASYNDYCQRTFVPGGHLEADETVIRWYGKGGAFVDTGLPMYLALERKPDNGVEIQNHADVVSGIMLHLKVVKSANEEKAITAAAADAIAANDGNNAAAADEAGKGTQVLLELTEPWHHSDCLVTVNAYFASMEAALAMKEKGLTFIGNVKQCSRRFPMEFLENTTLPQRGS
jgi:hypothetical protein